MPKQNFTFLLVDDDFLEHEKIKKFLARKESAFELVSCYDGEEAINWLNVNKHSPPKLILLDLNMPRMNGHEFLEEIKKDHHLKKIPVVIFTTSDSEQDRMRSFEHQAAGYIVKPMIPQEYDDMIGTITNYWDYSKSAF